MIPNIIVSISGLPKVGKTHFACTFPDPIKIYSFDLGADFVRGKFPDKDITVVNFSLPIIDDEDADAWALPVWEEFYQMYQTDVVGGTYETLVIDTATALEQVIRQAALEAIQQLKPTKQKLATKDYLVRNLRMKAIFDLAKTNGVNLATIQYMREKWAKRGGEMPEPTGEIVLSGWEQTEGFADINIEMVTKFTNKTIMVSTLKSNRFDRDVSGKTFNDFTYDELVTMLFEEE